MDELYWYKLLLTMLFILAPFVFITLHFISAPYGRYIQKQLGPQFPGRVGWFLMEFPAVLIIFLFYLWNNAQPVSYIFLVLWEMHYLNRALIYPFRLKNPKSMPVMIILMGAIFNIINGYLNGLSLTVINSYEIAWVYDPRFIIGVLLFITGFIINLHSDAILLNLRKPGETGYKIPQGGLFRWMSCPNYFGEIIEWIGWAIATWSVAGLAFAIWTIANLFPRALAHHHWYRETFVNYPKERGAIMANKCWLGSSH